MSTTYTGHLVIKKKMSLWRYSHFDPWGGLFRNSEVKAVIASDLGCAATLIGLWYWSRWLESAALVFWLYIVPWCWVNHWIVMITYLHHTHPDLPKYSADSWTFVRGATATVDRPLLGWIGRFFMHNVGHDHVAHRKFQVFLSNEINAKLM